MDGLLDRWMTVVGWMDEDWMDEWMDRWMDR